MLLRSLIVCLPTVVLLLVPRSALAIVNGSFEDPTILPWLTTSPSLNVPSSAQWRDGLQSAQIGAGGSTILQELIPGRCGHRLNFYTLFGYPDLPDTISRIVISYSDGTQDQILSLADPAWIAHAQVGGGSDPGWFLNTIAPDITKLITQVAFTFGDFTIVFPAIYLDQVSLFSCILLLNPALFVDAYQLPFTISFETKLIIQQVSVLASDNIKDLEVAFGSPITLKGQLVEERAGSVLLEVLVDDEAGLIQVTIDEALPTPLLGAPALLALGVSLLSLSMLAVRRRTHASR